MNQKLKKFTIGLAVAATAFAMTVPTGAQEAQAAKLRKVTASSKVKKAPYVKKGRNRITLKASSSSVILAVKFKVPSTKTYTLKFTSLRYKKAADRQSYGNLVLAGSNVQIPRKSGGRMRVLKIKGGYKKAAYYCSDEYYSVLQQMAATQDSNQADAQKLLNTVKVRTSKTVKVKLKKGQTVYIATSVESYSGGTFTCDLTIK